MSHYSQGAVEIKDPESLVLALQELGFTPEVHLEAQPLYGFQGDLRPERAHIIVRRAEIGSASNDVGFLIGPGGKIEAFISDYDARGRFTAELMGRLTQLAGVHSLLKKCKSRGIRAERRVGEAGKVQVVVHA